MKWSECGENHCTLLFLCQKVFSGINVLIYNERLCVCVRVSRLGLLSLHYTRAGSTPVLCLPSLPLPVLARNNELRWMPWEHEWVAQKWTPFLLKLPLRSHSNGSLMLLLVSSMYPYLRAKGSIHTFSLFIHLSGFFSGQSSTALCEITGKSKE